MCACMCVLCVRAINIQRCKPVPEHTHIQILMQRLMYVEVWNIMVLNPNVPDLNKHEQTPDVVRERPCRGSNSWKHIIERRGRHIHSHTRTDIDTHTHTCVQTDTWHSYTHTYTYTHTHTCRHKCTQTHKYAHTPKQTRTHTHARTQTHTCHAYTRKHARGYTHDTRGGDYPSPRAWA
jgi:hypothetical protein